MASVSLAAACDATVFAKSNVACLDQNPFDGCEAARCSKISCPRSPLSDVSTTASEHEVPDTPCTVGDCSPWEANDSQECHPDEIDSVDMYLTAMNTASDVVNAVQRTLSERERDRVKLVAQWTALEAQLTRSIGKDRLTRARRHRDAQRRVQVTLEAVEMASAKYMTALDVNDLEGVDLNALAEQHSMRLAKYQAAQKDLANVQKTSVVSVAAWEAVAPYFAAENKHRSHLADLDAELIGLASELKEARQTYRGAIRALEEISETIHRRRSDANLQSN